MKQDIVLVTPFRTIFEVQYRYVILFGNLGLIIHDLAKQFGDVIQIFNSIQLGFNVRIQSKLL